MVTGAAAGIVDISCFSESEAIEPFFDNSPAFLIKTLLVQRSEDFFLCETEGSRIFVRGRGDDLEVVQIRK